MRIYFDTCSLQRPLDDKTQAMVVQTRPLAEVTQAAIRVLCREIGPVDTMRFVGQFTVGYGDYTAERDELFEGMTLDDMIAEIKRRRDRR